MPLWPLYTHLLEVLSETECALTPMVSTFCSPLSHQNRSISKIRYRDRLSATPQALIKLFWVSRLNRCHRRASWASPVLSCPWKKPTACSRYELAALLLRARTQNQCSTQEILVGRTYVPWRRYGQLKGVRACILQNIPLFFVARIKTFHCFLLPELLEPAPNHDPSMINKPDFTMSLY